MTITQTKIYEAVKQHGKYILTALNTDQERQAVRVLHRQGVLKIDARTPETITFTKNWQ